MRQPLETLYVERHFRLRRAGAGKGRSLILEELNVKEIEVRIPWKRWPAWKWLISAVVSETGSAVAVSTYITMELQAEGIAREIVHRLQTMRRTAGYEIADHIIMYYEGDAFFVQAISAFADYIRQETLADDIEEGIPEDVDLQEEHKISGYHLTLGVKKVS